MRRENRNYFFKTVEGVEGDDVFLKYFLSFALHIYFHFILRWFILKWYLLSTSSWW